MKVVVASRYGRSYALVVHLARAVYGFAQTLVDVAALAPLAHLLLVVEFYFGDQKAREPARIIVQSGIRLWRLYSRCPPWGLARPFHGARLFLRWRNFLRRAPRPPKHGARLVQRARALLPATRPPCPPRAPASLGLQG